MKNKKESKKQEDKEQRKKFGEKFNEFYDKRYKLFLILPIIMIILSLSYMGVFYSNNNDFMYKDISLEGGTSITIQGKIDRIQLEQDLGDQLEEITTRRIDDIITREQQAIIIETTSDSETAKNVLEDYLGYRLTEENSSIEFTTPALGEAFYKQLLIALAFAFFFMSLVVFLIFRSFVPSIAVIMVAFADILMTLTVVNILGIKLSTAGIIAFLMLIGYSVDTDILLTTRVLKRDKGTVNSRLFGAFKTGLTMSFTSLLAISLTLIVIRPFSPVLTQIFTVLSIGLAFDIFNTWTNNASLIKWYSERK